MAEPLLVIRELHKRFGATEALRGVTFDVAAGDLFGLLGPNGAGKTTLLSILACLADPTSGCVAVDGHQVSRRDLALRRIVGVATQELAIYGELTARENLAFFGRLYGLRGGDLDQRIAEVLEFVGLRDRADQRVSAFSGGMKRRLNLGVAIMHRPRLLLLDEPTAGVDPQSRNHIFERVRELNAAGTTIIYTTHYMEEVQSLCPRVGILDRGKLIACDSLAALLRTIEGTIHLRVRQTTPALMERFADLTGVRLVQTPGETIELAAADMPAALVQVINALRQADVELLAIRIDKPSLERVFLRLTEKELRD